MHDDLELVTAWRGGDADAGERLVERYLEAIHRFFSNKVRGSVDDLVQKTFLACVESVEGFEGRSSFRSYLFAIARNVLYRHYRDGEGGFDPLTVSAAARMPDQGSVADRLATREEQRLLLLALRRLPLELQTMLELAYWEGLADRELAEVLGVPTGTVKSRLRRARALLDQELATLAPSESLLQSSLHTLSAWAAEIRAQTGIEGGKGRR
ncbi:MAG: sigma-70 family RNA polymerase sigma factor [Myxococcales bacterium]|nr:sigma-70 family RNA polymerase sigma factor [Myxococcales bacterium]